MILPPGAYLTLGLLAAFFAFIGMKRKERGNNK
jgi:electron transport complex protein RnfE